MPPFLTWTPVASRNENLGHSNAIPLPLQSSPCRFAHAIADLHSDSRSGLKRRAFVRGLAPYKGQAAQFNKSGTA